MRKHSWPVIVAGVTVCFGAWLGMAQAAAAEVTGGMILLPSDAALRLSGPALAHCVPEWPNPACWVSLSKVDFSNMY